MGSGRWPRARGRPGLGRLGGGVALPVFWRRRSSRRFSTVTRGHPPGWMSRMRTSLAELTPRFSTQPHAAGVRGAALSARAQAYRTRIADDAAESKRLFEWQKSIERNWHGLRFEGFRVQKKRITIPSLRRSSWANWTPDAVAVQLYAEPAGRGSA